MERGKKLLKNWKLQRDIYTHECVSRSITLSPIEYIDLEVIKLFKKTFEIKVSFIEFFAFYYPFFTFEIYRSLLIVF